MAGEEMLVYGGSITNVEIGAQGVREIAQNVRMILATRRGTCFLDRNFGVRQDMIDDPMPAARAKMIGEVVRKVEYYEPRVKVVSVEMIKPDDIALAMDGQMIPAVRIRIREGVAL